MTQYLRITRDDAVSALEKTLSIDSPAFYEEITRFDALNAIRCAGINKIQSWDGYLIEIARRFKTQHGMTIEVRLVCSIASIIA